MISDADCAASYGGILNYGFNPETMVCAGKQTVGVKDACQGDSGGPLVARTATGFVQVGAVSFGLFCGLPLFYGVYARIGAPELHGWLAKRLGDPGGSGPQVLAEPSEVRVGVSHARRREHGRVLRVRVRATAPVTALKLTVLRRGKVLGSARLPRLRRAATLRIRTGRFHGQRLHLRVTATDAGGARVTERRTVVPRG
jgi:hypothetical protein